MSVVLSYPTTYPTSDRNKLNEYRQELKAKLLAQNEKLEQELFFAQRCVNAQLEKNKTLMETIENQTTLLSILTEDRTDLIRTVDDQRVAIETKDAEIQRLRMLLEAFSSGL